MIHRVRTSQSIYVVCRCGHTCAHIDIPLAPIKATRRCVHVYYVALFNLAHEWRAHVQGYWELGYLNSIPSSTVCVCMLVCICHIDVVDVGWWYWRRRRVSTQHQHRYHRTQADKRINAHTSISAATNQCCVALWLSFGVLHTHMFMLCAILFRFEYAVWVVWPALVPEFAWHVGICGFGVRLDTCIAVNSFPGCNANMQCQPEHECVCVCLWAESSKRQHFGMPCMHIAYMQQWIRNCRKGLYLI